MQLFTNDVNPIKFQYLVLEESGTETCAYCKAERANGKLLHTVTCSAIVVCKVLGREKIVVDDADDPAV
jgi:hypothetical protein